MVVALPLIKQTRNELGWYEKAQTNNTKYAKETRPAVPKRYACSVAQHN